MVLYSVFTQLVVKVSWIGSISRLCPANERRCYFVMTSLIGWVQAYNHSCIVRQKHIYYLRWNGIWWYWRNFNNCLLRKLSLWQLWSSQWWKFCQHEKISVSVVFLVKYAHGFVLLRLCYKFLMDSCSFDIPIFFRVASLALGQSNCPCAIELILHQCG